MSGGEDYIFAYILHIPTFNGHLEKMHAESRHDQQKPGRETDEKTSFQARPEDPEDDHQSQAYQIEGTKEDVDHEEE